MLPSMRGQPLLIPPGRTLGILGGGQLGRMLALEARRLGYRIAVFSPVQDAPAGQIADIEVIAPYTNEEALRTFARRVDVVTLEFENVPVRAVEVVAEHTIVRPSVEALRVAQDRVLEKSFFREIGLACVPFAPITSEEELRRALTAMGGSGVLKTRRSGYDGKGQCRIEDAHALGDARALIAQGECILEGFAPFTRELSVVAARAVDGSIADHGVMENIHRDHILDITIAPARVPDEVKARAIAMTHTLIERLEYVGVLCLELFLLADGTLLANEFAPRPHNSGHVTLDACATDQFSQQMRAVCGLPLGPTAQYRPAVMVNLLGHMWPAGKEPDWGRALRTPGAKLHLYGKQEIKRGRKMGHLTALGETIDEALERAQQARNALFGW